LETTQFPQQEQLTSVAQTDDNWSLISYVQQGCHSQMTGICWMLLNAYESNSKLGFESWLPCEEEGFDDFVFIIFNVIYELLHAYSCLTIKFEVIFLI